MPIYVLKCSEGHRFERYMSIAEMETDSVKCACGQSTAVQIVPVMFSKPFESYQCPVTDKVIRSKLEHENNLKKHGCHVLETGERQQAIEARQAAERQLDKEVDREVDVFIDKLPGDRRETFVKEIASGVDAQLIRQTK